jgi:hypothetical protein
VVEELPQAYRKQEIAENRVIQAGQKQRTGCLVGKGEEESPNYA